MKYNLIDRYYDLCAARSAALTSPHPVVGYPALVLEIMRIDTILYDRYQYDISLTRNFN